MAAVGLGYGCREEGTQTERYNVESERKECNSWRDGKEALNGWEGWCVDRGADGAACCQDLDEVGSCEGLTLRRR